MDKQKLCKARFIANLAFAVLFLALIFVVINCEFSAYDQKINDTPDEGRFGAAIAFILVLGVLLCFACFLIVGAVLCFLSAMRFKRYLTKDSFGKSAFVLEIIGKISVIAVLFVVFLLSASIFGRILYATTMVACLVSIVLSILCSIKIRKQIQ